MLSVGSEATQVIFKVSQKSETLVHSELAFSIFEIDHNPPLTPAAHTLLLELKYYSGSPVISAFERVSKPGRRIFSSASSLPKINNGLGIAIISTPKGVMTDIDARKQKVGGEIICKVF